MKTLLPQQALLHTFKKIPALYRLSSLNILIRTHFIVGGIGGIQLQIYQFLLC